MVLSTETMAEKEVSSSIHAGFRIMKSFGYDSSYDIRNRCFFSCPF
jgi:hypothetical protein